MKKHNEEENSDVCIMYLLEDTYFHIFFSFLFDDSTEVGSSIHIYIYRQLLNDQWRRWEYKRVPCYLLRSSIL